MPGTYYGYDYNEVLAFDNAYWSAQPIPVQALKGMDPTTGNLYNQAMKLAGQGYFIDNAIMVWQWDPFFTMLQRDGETYPDALKTQTRVASTDITKYPPVPVPVPSSGPLVGVIIGFGPYYFPTLLATQSNIPAGQNVTENGVTYMAEYIPVGKIDSSPNAQLVLRWEKVS